MLGFLKMLAAPFTTAFILAASLWNKTGDWGWNVAFRITALVGMFGTVLFFFFWCSVGFQWPPF